eukprot:s252_g2.t1
MQLFALAWCGLHDEHGHGGVFARRIHPKLGPPFTAFTHPNRVEGMTWGGSRLALLVHAPNCLVWTVWDAELAETRSGGCLTVAPTGFVPNRVFSGRVLPFFDQFERRLRFWNPGNDALVYADAESEVWLQKFPREVSLVTPSTPHPLSSLFGGEELRVAPPRVRIAEGSFALPGTAFPRPFVERKRQVRGRRFSPSVKAGARGAMTHVQVDPKVNYECCSEDALLDDGRGQLYQTLGAADHCCGC